jgi:DNA invertase Pin-like site-specific DNA recombinase
MAASLPDPTPFIDPGVSGSVPLSKRPEGGRMYAALQKGDLIVAAKLDRLFRSALDALTVVEDLKARGVKLILADLGSDPVTDSGISKLFFSIMASMAEFEKTRIAERMDDGRKGKKARGGHIGGKAPYGFRKVGAGRDAMLEPDPDEQAIIDLARQMRGSGASLGAIARQLAADGKLARAGKPFEAMQIARMCEAA